MMSSRPSSEQWRRAYELAAQVYELAPWRWMWDTDHFGFEDPQTGGQHFISVMGRNGEHFAIAVYRGAETLFQIYDYVADPSISAEVMLDTTQLQLSFEDRGFLRPEDRSIMKQLGLSFRGRNGWPCFRSYLPGQFPWFLDAEELRLLLVGLEQVMAVAPRFKENQAELERLNQRGMDEHVFLMRVPVPGAEPLQWEERSAKIARPVTAEVMPERDPASESRVRQFPLTRNKVEVDLRPMPEPVQEGRHERPFFPYLLLVVDASSGFILGCEMLLPVPALDAVYRKAPLQLLCVLARHGQRPSEIRVRTERLRTLFTPLCAALAIAIKVQPSLPRTEDALASLQQFHRGR